MELRHLRYFIGIIENEGFREPRCRTGVNVKASCLSI